MSYEVFFRGRNAAELDDGEVQLDTSKGELRAWKPTPLNQFECSAEVALNRYAELIRDGIAGTKVDDVVPFVVVIYHVQMFVRDGEERRRLTMMVWGYAEVGAAAEGNWADEVAV